MRYIVPLLLLCCLMLNSGCGMLYGVYDDQRLGGTISDDKEISLGVKSDLMDANLSQGWGIKVYCYYGHVFLVGEAPEKMRSKAIRIARRHKGVRSVTSHWFTPAKSDTGDFVLATKLRTELIGTSGLSSTRIDTEVNAGRVVLLGVVKDEAERKLAIRAARQVEGVKQVIRYFTDFDFDSVESKLFGHREQGSPIRSCRTGKGDGKITREQHIVLGRCDLVNAHAFVVHDRVSALRLHCKRRMPLLDRDAHSGGKLLLDGKDAESGVALRRGTHLLQVEKGRAASQVGIQLLFQLLRRALALGRACRKGRLDISHGKHGMKPCRNDCGKEQDRYECRQEGTFFHRYPLARPKEAALFRCGRA